ncbi:thiol-disulfide oxidoreductase DCC family protein [Virgibacillus sp. AGTR]|uniref:thiol-disulfide oxidoreductase DCC family protein n=1 Tax=unclassified Virgibacillus TaxID=2620237 RepID=UPI000EF52918|nr:MULTISPECIES: thiol-disulfide oxidoreductase DCC family protein [unclassified Virgibacillus]MCC2249914.1 thiol-disulfide oxidoreductase DCC family protein [Virgibacillus sp. AGTR]MDY7045953.1 thiol-disulfide oxidoreductase DCC family protein [Virgibacillus sp. M23]QRZ18685.1 thiol-disulfide oxidoreductase DCC family protein [Virgibacillus sp. AGTR]
MSKVILFDGVCNFCDQSVQFILKRDKQEQFTFASIQGDAGQELLKRNHVATDMNSFILIDGNKTYFKSTAALRVCKELNGAWKLLYGFMIIPKPLRDFLYGVIANHRYEWFGQKQSCTLPSPETRKRFL